MVYLQEIFCRNGHYKSNIKSLLPFSIYVTPFYFDKQPPNEIHFLVELHGGEAFCCKYLTLEQRWEVTLRGDYPGDLVEMAYEVIGKANPVVLLGEVVDVEDL